MKINHLLKMSLCLLACCFALTSVEAKHRNFKVSVYVRAYEVDKMKDTQWLESTWKTISDQLDVDKIYLETHRDLYDYPEAALNEIRRTMSQDMDFYMEGPAKVSLFMYDNKTLIVENFNDEPVDIKLVGDTKFKKFTNLEDGNVVNANQEDILIKYTRKPMSKFAMTVKPHSYMAFKYE